MDYVQDFGNNNYMKDAKKLAQSQRARPMNMLQLASDGLLEDDSMGDFNITGQHNQLVNTRYNHKMLNFCPDIHEFSWDPDNSSKEISFSSDYRHAFLADNNYLFRTIISNRPFMDGHHYWEIIADARTEHELKIGVTS